MDIFYNYVLLDTTKPGRYDYGRGLTFKFEPFYVGKGKQGRCNHHFRKGSLKADSEKNRRIKRIKRITGEWPIVSIKKKNISEGRAFNCERKIIELIGRADRKAGPLLNKSAGGAGSSGRIEPPEVRQRMSESGKLRVANMTEKEKRQHAKRMSKVVTEVWSTLTKQQRSERVAKGHLKRDASVSQKIANSVASVHANRTPEQKAAIAEKIRQTLLRRNAERRAAMA